MPYSYRDIEKKLFKLGYKKIRQKGSHVLFSNGKITFPVPCHAGRDISVGVENKIYKIISMTKKEFFEV